MARGGRTAQQQRFARAAKVCTTVLGRGASRRSRNACMKRELTGRGGRFRGYGPPRDSDWTEDTDLDPDGGYGSPLGRRHRSSRGGRRRRNYRARHGGTVLYR